MNSVVLKENFKDGLLVAERIASKSPSLPILGNILISTKANALEISSTDLEIGVRYTILSKNESEGMAVVPSRALPQFIGLVPGPQIMLASKTQGLEVESGEFRAVFKTLSAEDFPIIPPLKGGEEFVDVETRALCQGLSSVVNFVGQTQVRPEISGVFFLFQKNTLRLVSTDSFRLAEKTLYFKKENVKERSFILPSKTARELISIFQERGGKMRIFFPPTQVLFDYSLEGQPQEPKIQLVSRVIEGEYPKYQDVIPSSEKTRAVVNREELLNHVRASSVFSGKMNDVRLAFDPSKQRIEIVSKKVDLGENTSFLKGQLTGDGVEISFNWRFLGEGLAQMKSEKVEFGATTEDGPALIRPLGQDGYLYVVMPIKA